VRDIVLFDEGNRVETYHMANEIADGTRHVELWVQPTTHVHELLHARLTNSPPEVNMMYLRVRVDDADMAVNLKNTGFSSNHFGLLLEALTTIFKMKQPFN
jgi:hypothetical protein